MYTKMNSKWTIDLNTSKTVKLLQKIYTNICNHSLGKTFLAITPKTNKQNAIDNLF